jgi:hypothetical protein
MPKRLKKRKDNAKCFLVQGSSRQSKAEIQANKNRLLQICLSILEIFWYLWYPGDPPRDAKSLGRSLCLWGAVYQPEPGG